MGVKRMKHKEVLKLVKGYNAKMLFTMILAIVQFLNDLKKQEIENKMEILNNLDVSQLLNDIDTEIKKSKRLRK